MSGSLIKGIYVQDFILLMGVESKIRNHHPELRNVRQISSFPVCCGKDNGLICSCKSYKSVWYHWTTHTPGGLSEKDLHMARVCDEKAKLLGHQD